MHLKHRSLVSIFVLNCITLNLYQVYWYFITKTEMNVLNPRDKKVPFFLWFFISPINIWWLYRFCKAMSYATKGELNKWTAFFAPIVIGLVVAVMFVLTNTDIKSFSLGNSSLSSYAIGTLLLSLPILYYQSYLNKVSK